MAFLMYVPNNALRHWMLILVGLLALRLFFDKFRKHLRSIPGPSLAGYTDLWRFFNGLVATPHKTRIDLRRKYHSKIIMIYPHKVSVSDTTLIPKVYSLNSGFTKTTFYTLHTLPYKNQFTPSLFTNLDEGYRAKFRRPIANAYPMSTLVEFEPLIDTTTSLFIERLDEFAASKHDFDLDVWLQIFAFDVISEIVFSKKLGFLETKTDVDSTCALLSFVFPLVSLQIFAQRYFLGGAIGQTPAVDAVLTKNPRYLIVADTNPVVKFTVERMSERQNSIQQAVGPLDDTQSVKQQGAKDFRTRCYEAQEKYSDLATNRIIRMYNIDNVLAGSDITSISLRAVLYYLMKSPGAMKRCLAEIDSLDQSTEFITWKESNSMLYLQASIKEALRMHPAVGLLLERHVPKRGIELEGQYFPEDTIVGVNPWVAARSKEIYGPDADVFRPDRWLDADLEQLKAMERANLTFGSRARSCIGKNVSMLEIAKVVPQLLRHYEFRFPPGNDEWNIVGGWFVGQHNLELQSAEGYRPDRRPLRDAMTLRPNLFGQFVYSEDMPYPLYRSAVLVFVFTDQTRAPVHQRKSRLDSQQATLLPILHFLVLFRGILHPRSQVVAGGENR